MTGFRSPFFILGASVGVIAPVPPAVRASKGGRSGGAWWVTPTDYGYLVETGSGTLKINSKYMLDLEAQNAGATLRWR